MDERSLQRDGCCLLEQVVTRDAVHRMLEICRDTFDVDSEDVRSRSSHGHVYAARNLIASIPEVTTVWQCESLATFLPEQLGESFDLVRA